MQQDQFGQSVLEAYSFSGALIGSMNLAIGTLQMLVWKGTITKDEALYIIDIASESSAKMELPEPFQAGVAGAYESAKETLEAHSLA